MEKRVIIDDEFGHVVHYPGYLAVEEASKLYETLRDDIAWRQAHVKMYGKDYHPDRSISAQGSDEVRAYRFAGTAVAADAWTPPVRSLADALVEKFGLERNINYALLNYYHSGDSKLGYHSDSESDLEKGAPILSISLGTARDFLLQAYGGSRERHAKTIKVHLEPGDLLIMSRNTQQNFRHAVPARKRGGPRINITMRTMRATRTG